LKRKQIRKILLGLAPFSFEATNFNKGKKEADDKAYGRGTLEYILL